MKKWYAKSKRSGREQVEVKQHLYAVGKLSKEFGSRLGMEKEAEIAGTVHDAGKFTDKFQAVLEGEASRVDHARVSAAFLWWFLMKTSKYTKESISRTNYAPILEAINAHHGTLLCYNHLKHALCECMTAQKWLKGNDGKEVALTGEENYKVLKEIFCGELPQWKRIGIENMTLREEERMLWARLLLSCLVDADYTESAIEEGESIPEPPKCDAENWLKRLNTHRAQLARNSTADEKLNALRNELFETCGKAGDNAPGIYTLTAPTGTGKTLALLHFALRQCCKNGQERIIIVLPFIALTEQNAMEYRKILGDDVLLEDHSQRQLADEQRKFAQRWDMPVIVTTSVRFFEGLFAAKAPNLRKLHRLANSVIIFDEAQSLPAELLPATLKTIQALCNLPKKNVTMLFSTATQPDYRSIPNLTWQSMEICPNYAEMYQKLRRVQVTWRISLNERMSWEEIAQKMASQRSVCTIVNMKKHAKKLFDALQLVCEPKSVFYITTELCPAHRRAVIEQVKKRLHDGLPCRVIATQCIEAGVDLDFDSVFRALAPLEAIIQATGRCNRNGRHSEGGQVLVFLPDEDNLYPDNWYGKAAMLVKELNDEKTIDLMDPSDIQRYYQQLFRKLKGADKLSEAIKAQDYAGVEKNYRIIKNDGVQMLVSYEPENEMFEKLKEEALEHGVTAEWMRKAVPLCVTVYASDDFNRYAEQLYFAGNREAVQPSGYWVLRKKEDYHMDTGVQLKDSTLIW